MTYGINKQSYGNVKNDVLYLSHYMYVITFAEQALDQNLRPNESMNELGFYYLYKI